jgi:hypothetical protein
VFQVPKYLITPFKKFKTSSVIAGRAFSIPMQVIQASGVGNFSCTTCQSRNENKEGKLKTFSRGLLSEIGDEIGDD